MMTQLMIFSIVTMAITPSLCQTAAFFHGCCSSDWYQYAHSCYMPITSPATWKTAEDHCKRLNGHLASVHGEEEDGFIYLLMEMKNNPASQSYWIGATVRFENNQVKEKKWSDRSKWSYGNFGANKPPTASDTFFISSSLDSGANYTWKYSTGTETFVYVCKDNL